MVISKGQTHVWNAYNLVLKCTLKMKYKRLLIGVELSFFVDSLRARWRRRELTSRPARFSGAIESQAEHKESINDY